MKSARVLIKEGFMGKQKKIIGETNGI